MRCGSAFVLLGFCCGAREVVLYIQMLDFAEIQGCLFVLRQRQKRITEGVCAPGREAQVKQGMAPEEPVSSDASGSVLCAVALLSYCCSAAVARLW